MLANLSQVRRLTNVAREFAGHYDGYANYQLIGFLYDI
jgi:hypothetical protein